MKISQICIVYIFRCTSIYIDLRDVRINKNVTSPKILLPWNK